MDAVLASIYSKMNMHNSEYIEHLQSLIDQTYRKEVPCVEPTCEIYSATEAKVISSNDKFQRTVAMSAEFSSLLIDLEHILLRILAIEQTVELEKIIDKPENYDLESEDE